MAVIVISGCLTSLPTLKLLHLGGSVLLKSTDVSGASMAKFIIVAQPASVLSVAEG